MRVASETKPVFVFSLPRSGSTLLQRILASSAEISTTSESWIMLPLFSYMESLSTWSLYSSKAYRSAVNDLMVSLPRGEANLLEAAHAYGMSIYQNLGNGKNYYVDKTPRYHLIADRLIEAFPEGKFIFLWRNPLAVLASISRTWKKNRWTFGSYNIDIYDGLSSLVEAFNRHEASCLSIQYEDLVSTPEKTIHRVEDYLNLPRGSCNHKSIEPATAHAKMGDPTGETEYSDKISTESIDRWQCSYNTRFRKKTGISYLQWIGEDRLAKMGYSLPELARFMQQQPNTGLGLADYYYRLRDSIRVKKQSRLVKTMKKKHAGHRLS